MVYFHPKIPIWGNFGGSCNGRRWYIVLPFGIFYDQLVYFWPFGIFCGQLVYNFSLLWYAVPKKSGNPERQRKRDFEVFFRHAFEREVKMQ
jgi:hypothetical protein